MPRNKPNSDPFLGFMREAELTPLRVETPNGCAYPDGSKPQDVYIGVNPKMARLENASDGKMTMGPTTSATKGRINWSGNRTGE